MKSPAQADQDAATTLWRESADGILLLGSACTRCETVSFPPPDVCPDCLFAEKRQAPIGPVGRLYSYSIVRVPVPGFSVPYAVGYVDFPQKIRVFGQLEDWEDDLELGIPMRIVVGSVGESAEGESRQGYKFQPVTTEEETKHE